MVTQIIYGVGLCLILERFGDIKDGFFVYLRKDMVTTKMVTQII